MLFETENNFFDIGDNDNVSTLFTKTYNLSQVKFFEKDYKCLHNDWLKLIRDTKTTTVEDLISLVSLISTRDIRGGVTTSRELKAFREAILAEIYRRNAQSISITMTKLDQKGLLLSRVGTAIAVCTFFFTIVSIL